jgi:hypothetical protein
MINQLNIDQKKYILEKRIGMWKSNQSYIKFEIDKEKSLEIPDQSKIDNLNNDLNIILSNIQVLSTELENLI